MSSNKGKDGELEVVILVAEIGKKEDGVDLTRQSVANSADMGSDLNLHGPKGYLKKFEAISNGKFEEASSMGVDLSKQEVARIDVKNTSKPIQSNTVDKFIDDTYKHPSKQGDILMGGPRLTGPAQEKFNTHKENMAKKGRTVIYINQDQISNLKVYYSKGIEDKSDD